MIPQIKPSATWALRRSLGCMARSRPLSRACGESPTSMPGATCHLAPSWGPFQFCLSDWYPQCQAIQQSAPLALLIIHWNLLAEAQSAIKLCHETELAACTLTGEAWKACSSRLSSSSNMLLSALPSQKVEKGLGTSRLGSPCMKLLAPLLGELPPATELQEATAACNSRSAPRPMRVALNMRGSTMAMTHWRPACHSRTGAPQHIPRAIPLLGGPPPCPTDSLIHRQFFFPVAGSPASSLYPVQ